jgi:hypothetical protein
MLHAWGPSLLRSVLITILAIGSAYAVLMGLLWLTIIVNRI